MTHAAAWTAALNDGKIRIPTSGIKAVTPEMASVLRHELTHSFVPQITHDRAPTWLNEGIAQLEEGRTTADIGPRLASLYASGGRFHLISWKAIFRVTVLRKPLWLMRRAWLQWNISAPLMA